MNKYLACKNLSEYLIGVRMERSKDCRSSHFLRPSNNVQNDREAIRLFDLHCISKGMTFESFLISTWADRRLCFIYDVAGKGRTNIIFPPLNCQEYTSPYIPIYMQVVF